MSGNGREELARRLHRIFLADVANGREVEQATLLEFADDLLAPDYTDEQYGPRKGDGGPAARFVVDRP